MIPVQKSFPPSLLRRWRKVILETPYLKQRDAFKKWKLSQDRAKLVYTLVAAAVLAVIAFVVTNGGCR